MTVVAVGGAVVLAAIWYGRDPRSPWERVASGGRLTLAVASEQPAFDPAISADGKMLTYGIEDSNGSADLFVRRVAGGSLVRLTNDGARENAPRFSPDGEWIAFTRRESQGIPEIRIIPALGGDPVSIIPGAAGAIWAPDGKRLAFLKWTSRGPGELVIASLDGSDARVLLQADSTFPFLRHAAWSPDGNEVAIVRGSGGIAGEIWLLPLGGGAPRRAMTDPPEVFSDSPVYTADGLGLIHSSNRGGATNIWFLPLRGGHPVRLTAGPGPDTVPTVAADGTIAFINSRWRNTLELYGPLDKLTASPSAVRPRTLTTHAPFLWAPSFSPDGKEVAYSRAEVDGSWHIWTVPIEGGTPRRITSSASGEVYSRYTRDGAFILFHTWGSPRRIGRVPRDGGAPRMLSFGQASDGFPDVSPDGKSIAMTRTDNDAERIYIAPATEGDARLLTKTPGSVAKWSPDGRSLVFAGNRGYAGGIFVVDADGSHERRISATGGWPVWFPDGRHIGFQAVGHTGDLEIHVLPVEGGPTQVLSSIKFSATNHPFDVSPDGRTVATTNSVHVSDEIWFMEPRAR